MTSSHRSSNRLNDLDGKSWVKSTKSWFIVNPPRRKSHQVIHPAKYPESLVNRFVSFFTNEYDWVLDPFAGVGSTLVACKMIDRNSVGIELDPEFVQSGEESLMNTNGSGDHHLLAGDSSRLVDVLSQFFKTSPVPQFDYLITSPPYWNMLSKSRGGNDTSHKERAEKGLRIVYSQKSTDLGNIENYHEYVEAIGMIFDDIEILLKPGAYLTVVAQNMRDVDGRLRPIAWDLARRLSKTYELRQEQIWCQDNKRLGCWGYPTTYVSNVHHHYCLIFQKA